MAKNSARSAVVAVAVVLATSACNAAITHRDSAEPHRAGGASPTPAQSEPSGGPASEAIAAYRAMWEDDAEASRTSNESDPRLTDHARDGALGLLRLNLRQAHQSGVISKGAPHLDPEVVARGADRVRLRDCVDATSWLQYRADGQLKNAVPGGHHYTEATVVRTSGRWQVSELSWRGSGSC